MAIFLKLAKNLLKDLAKAPAGARPSQKYDNYYLNPEGAGRFPLRFRFEKAVGPKTGQVYRLMMYHRKKGRGQSGHGYAIDHLELNFFQRTRQEIEELGEQVLILDFAWCDKGQDIALYLQPIQVWRIEGKDNRGVMYAYDPEEIPEILIGGINTQIVDQFPVRVSAVGVLPVEREKNSTVFPKYNVEGAEALYDRRQSLNGFGLLELVETSKQKRRGCRSWKYFNLKDFEGEVPADAAELTANEDRTKLVVKRRW